MIIIAFILILGSNIVVFVTKGELEMETAWNKRLYP